MDRLILIIFLFNFTQLSGDWNPFYNSLYHKSNVKEVVKTSTDDIKIIERYDSSGFLKTKFFYWENTVTKTSFTYYSDSSVFIAYSNQTKTTLKDSLISKNQDTVLFLIDSPNHVVRRINNSDTTRWLFFKNSTLQFLDSVRSFHRFEHERNDSISSWTKSLELFDSLGHKCYKLLVLNLISTREARISIRTDYEDSKNLFKWFNFTSSTEDSVRALSSNFENADTYTLSEQYFNNNGSLIKLTYKWYKGASQELLEKGRSRVRYFGNGLPRKYINKEVSFENGKRKKQTVIATYSYKYY